VEQIHKIAEAMERAKRTKGSLCERGLYLFVHNIDAEPLRKGDSQMLLRSLLHYVVLCYVTVYCIFLCTMSTRKPCVKATLRCY
jgi:hypothetical protein